ncbi:MULTISPECIES: hypothetical protein [Paenibacillus]|uniref:Uncharacterized protein n=1 Tax=Paenibacillus illinoisensis TaxID=59845 RepID=A0A2W0CK12_9BACL|nr:MULTISPECIES: hypothetical protein [Paenibacillus]PAD29302.1 hypothetical protein CHH60_21610 [Paenibacillus sp. 7523-1]PYY31259.1 Uncharacterized protein PIL02S_00350 [Paenibacillus illinoisensis]
MDYELFINNSSEAEKIGNIIFEIMKEVIGKEVKVEKLQHKLGYQYVYIESEYLTIDIDLEDEDGEMEEYHEMNLKYYSVNTNMRINIQLFSKTFDTSWLKLIETVGQLLSVVEGDVLLLDDRSFPIMKRTNNVLLVNNDLDEYQIKYITKESLKLLNCHYVERSFKAE